MCTHMLLLQGKALINCCCAPAVVTVLRMPMVLQTKLMSQQQSDRLAHPSMRDQQQHRGPTHPSAVLEGSWPP